MLGRRGLILVMVGLMWVLYGFGVAMRASPSGGSADFTPGVFHTYLPIWIRVTLWIGTGTVAVWSAVWQTPRWQAVGFGALVMLPAERTLSYLVGWGLQFWPGIEGAPNGWMSALVWLMVASLIVVISGWPEAPPAGREAVE